MFANKRMRSWPAAFAHSGPHRPERQQPPELKFHAVRTRFFKEAPVGVPEDADAVNKRRVTLDWIQTLRVGGEWEPCDVGVDEVEAKAEDTVSDDGGIATDVPPTTVRKYDTSVRVCQRAPAAQWVDNNPIILNAARSILTEAGVQCLSNVSFRDCEVLLYEPGGFFEVHVDRKRHDNHAGTLILVAASEDAKGGALVVPSSKCRIPECPYLAFIPLGVEHQVLPLTAGKRCVAKASVVLPSASFTAYMQRRRGALDRGLKD